MKIELHKQNIELFDEMRKMFRGHIPNIDEMSYNALIFILHQGFTSRELAEQIEAQITFAKSNLNWEKLNEDLKDD